MKNEPLVSIIMSVFNGEQFLRESVNSILNQTYKNYEIIVIDDGSTDNTNQILSSYVNSKLQVYKNETNQGLIYSLNKAIQLAQGNLLARMDADDIAMPHRLETQVSYFDNYPELAILGSAYYLRSHKRNKLHIPAIKLGAIQANTLFNSPFGHPTVMLNRAVIGEDRLKYNKDYKHAEDYELWSNIVFNAVTSNIAEPLLTYRVHSNQVSVAFNHQQQIAARQIRRNILNQLDVTFDESELIFLDSTYRAATIDDFITVIRFFDKIRLTTVDNPSINHLEFYEYISRHLLSTSTQLGMAGLEALNNSPFGDFIKFKSQIKHWIKTSMPWSKRR